jgi:tRNA(fMet)-specific endonuclease VapC
MKFLLDANICSVQMRRPARLAHHFLQHHGQLAVSTVTLGELYAGAWKQSFANKLFAHINDFMLDVAILDLDPACAVEFGRIRGTLLRKGRAGNHIDLMIGATAIVHDLTLVTDNTVDFAPIIGLRMVNWLG